MRLEAETALYLEVMLLIVTTSTFNIAMSVRIFWRLRMGLALLLALWPFTALIPISIELYYLQWRIKEGIATTNMGARWLNIGIVLVATMYQLHILLRNGYHNK